MCIYIIYITQEFSDDDFGRVSYKDSASICFFFNLRGLGAP